MGGVKFKVRESFIYLILDLGYNIQYLVQYANASVIMAFRQQQMQRSIAAATNAAIRTQEIETYTDRQGVRRYRGKITVHASNPAAALAMLTNDATLVALVGIEEITSKMSKYQAITSRHFSDQKDEKNKWLCIKISYFLFVFVGFLVLFFTMLKEKPGGEAALMVLGGFLLVTVGPCIFWCWYKKGTLRALTRSNPNEVMRPAIRALFQSWTEKGMTWGWVAKNPRLPQQKELLTFYFPPPLNEDGDVPIAEVAIAMPLATPLKSESMTSAAERLSEAKSLLDAGLITEEMFVEKQKSILQNV